jgi:hypothetical protein
MLDDLVERAEGEDDHPEKRKGRNEEEKGNADRTQHFEHG